MATTSTSDTVGDVAKKNAETDKAPPAVVLVADGSGATPPPKKGKKPAREKEPATSFSALFRYATPFDLWMYALASISAAGNGVIFPIFSLFFGSLLGNLNNSTAGIEGAVNHFSLIFLIIALAAGVATFLEIALPMMAAERQIKRVREAYLKALLRQDQGFYDTNKGSELVRTQRSSGLRWRSFSILDPRSC